MNASSTITARSHAICSSFPPPTAIPLIRASVGLPISRRRSWAVLERPEPLPVLGRLAQVVVGPRLEVGADAEGAPGSRQDDDADLVVPGSVLAGARELAQHLEVEGVQDLGPVERDRRARRRLLVDDPLEAELVRRKRPRSVGLVLAHETSAKSTWKRPPISIASLPVAMNSSLRAASLKASRSGNSHSA